MLWLYILLPLGSQSRNEENERSLDVSHKKKQTHQKYF